MRDKRIDKAVQESASFSALAYQFNQKDIGASYLLSSTDKMLSKILLDNLLCKFYCNEQVDDFPCLKCTQCQKILDRNNIDVQYFGVSDQNIKKDEIRELLTNAITKPFEGNHKFLIIENGEKMSELVQNLLLKTLEDLPNFVTIIILTNSSVKILPTIRSRCQSYSIIPLQKRDVIKLIGSSSRSLDIARVADGQLEKALKYNEKKKFDNYYKFALNLLNSFASSADLVEFEFVLQDNKDDVKMIIEIVQSVFYLGMIGSIQTLVKKRKLAKVVRLCNSCINELEMGVLFNIVIDKLLINILKIKRE